MQRFASLLDRLSHEPRRGAKLTLLADHFARVPDPDRGLALAALTGGLRFRNAKPAMLRALVAERVDPYLFELSYDFVGDLSETIALIWPIPEDAPVTMTVVPSMDRTLIEWPLRLAISASFPSGLIAMPDG